MHRKSRCQLSRLDTFTLPEFGWIPQTRRCGDTTVVSPRARRCSRIASDSDDIPSKPTIVESAVMGCDGLLLGSTCREMLSVCQDAAIAACSNAIEACLNAKSHLKRVGTPRRPIPWSRAVRGLPGKPKGLPLTNVVETVSAKCQ